MRPVARLLVLSYSGEVRSRRVGEKDEDICVWWERPARFADRHQHLQPTWPTIPRRAHDGENQMYCRVACRAISASTELLAVLTYLGINVLPCQPVASGVAKNPVVPVNFDVYTG